MYVGNTDDLKRYKLLRSMYVREVFKVGGTNYIRVKVVLTPLMGTPVTIRGANKSVTYVGGT